MLLLHRGLHDAALLAMAVAGLLSAGVLGGKRERWLKAAVAASAIVLLLLLADALGRSPVVLRAGEADGTLAWAVVDVALRGALPVLLWALVLVGRWRGWLAEVVFASSVLIATGVTLAAWLLPL